LSEVSGEYIVDPVEDLRPVCPNCHAVLHLGGSCRSIENVKQSLAPRYADFLESIGRRASLGK
jgi:5-methylcytosine-specific restriction protein A